MPDGRSNNYRSRIIIPAILLVTVLFVAIWLQKAKNPVPSGLNVPLDTNPQYPSYKASLPHDVLSQTEVQPSTTKAGIDPVAYTKVTPKLMHVTTNVLVSKKWDDPDAFGLDRPLQGQEGATLGPSSVAYVNGTIYLLDNEKSRILSYDKLGNLISSITLPTQFGNDLVVDPTDSSLLVIDHLKNTIYKVVGQEVTVLKTVDLNGQFPFGTKFDYDPVSGNVSAQDLGGLADVNEGYLVIGNGGQKPLAITFDKPVCCIDEVVSDLSGNVWVLFAFEEERFTRQLARVNPVFGTVGVTQIDTWSAFDATRHMAATEDGVVIFSGDTQAARLMSFDYVGDNP